MPGARRRRLLVVAAAVVLAGTGCAVMSLVLAFAWAGTGAGGLMVASRWLTWCSWGFLAGAWACASLLWRRRPWRWPRRRSRDQYATWPDGWAAWCAPGREAEAAEFLAARGIRVTGITGHPFMPDGGEVILVNPDSGYQPGYGSTEQEGRGT